MAVARPRELNVDWQQLYELNAPDLRQTIRARVPPSVVEDVLQETFLALYRSAARVDFSRSVAPLLRTIATRQCVQWWRGNRRTEHDDRAAEAAPAAYFVGCDDHVAALAASDAVGSAFSTISLRHRRLLYRSTFQGERPDELALTEGCSEKAVRSALDRARATLRRQLGTTSALGGWAYRGRRRLVRLRLVDRAMIGERAGAALTAVGLVAVTFVPSPASSTRAVVDLGVIAAAEPLTDPSGRSLLPPTAQPNLGVAARPEQPTAPGAPERPGGTRPPISADAGVAVTHGPDSSAFELRADIYDPIGGRSHSVGKSVACNGGRVGSAACAVAPLVPE